jgi:hypothetical protein
MIIRSAAEDHHVYKTLNGKNIFPSDAYSEDEENNEDKSAQGR